ncbi:MAG: helix-turn-helix domain-containing protein [Holophagae bacterium]
MVTLIIEGAGGSQLTYQLDKQSISIGASSSNDVVLRDPGVAPQHVVLQRNGDVFTFLGQHRQVVVLNGERRARGVLRVGDKIRIGTASIVFKGSTDNNQDIELVEASAAEPSVEPEAPAPDRRSEIVLYREGHRLSEARAQLVEIFRSNVRPDAVPALRAYLGSAFTERQSLVALVDERGRFQPVVSQWEEDLPRLPAQTFEELAAAGRYAEMHLAGRLTLIYPIDRGADQSRAYLLAESSPEQRDDDLDLLGELARMLSVHWERVERSTALYTEWAGRCHTALQEAVPGTSQASKILRDSVGTAARSASPVMLCGPRSSGRMFLANLIASLRPAGPAPVHVFQTDPDDDRSVRVGLFGSDQGDAGAGPSDRFRGSAVVIRDVHLMSPKLQRELAAEVAGDLESGYGPSVRWMVTTGQDAAAMLNEGVLDATLYGLFERHVIRVPSLADRREDLPLLIVRLLERVGAEQGKEIRGIELVTLNSLLDHPFEDEMTELLEELRRLVSATPDGEMVRGLVPRGTPSSRDDGAVEPATPDIVGSVLEIDDLKRVIPEIERMIIDRVLQRTKGNQSQAARTLNLSRGALISKIKEYEIPDYRALRKKS